MFPAIGPISKIIKLLHSEVKPWQLATGLCFGMVMGITPLVNLHNLFILFLCLVIAVNFGAVTLGLALFSIVGFIIDPLADKIGLSLLNDPALRDFWTRLYNTPTLTWTHFNNSIVLGSLVIALALFVPLWAATWFFVRFYRERIMAGMEKLKIMKVLKGSSLYQTYTKIRNWTE